MPQNLDRAVVGQQAANAQKRREVAQKAVKTRKLNSQFAVWQREQRARDRDYRKRFGKAKATELHARTFAQYILTRQGYRRVFLVSRNGFESTGIVDLVAVRKRGDATEIVLLQVKGNRHVSPTEKERLRLAAKHAIVRWGIVECFRGSLPQIEFLDRKESGSCARS